MRGALPCSGCVCSWQSRSSSGHSCPCGLRRIFPPSWRLRSWYWKFDEMWKHLRFYLLLERRQTDADAPMRYSDSSPYLSPNRSSDWDAGEKVSQSWVCWFVCTRCAACSPWAPRKGVCMEGETRDSGDSSSLTHSRTDRPRHTDSTQGELRILGTAFLCRCFCFSWAPDNGTRCATRLGAAGPPPTVRNKKHQMVRKTREVRLTSSLLVSL